MDKRMLLSDIIHFLICFRKSTLPQKRQFDVLIGNSKQFVGEFVGRLAL